MGRILAALFSSFRRPASSLVTPWEEAVLVRHPVRCSRCNEPFADGATVLRRTSGGLEEVIHEACVGPRR